MVPADAGHRGDVERWLAVRENVVERQYPGGRGKPTKRTSRHSGATGEAGGVGCGALARVEHTADRQWLLCYRIVIHGKIDPLDPEHDVSRDRRSYPDELSVGPDSRLPLPTQLQIVS